MARDAEPACELWGETELQEKGQPTHAWVGKEGVGCALQADLWHTPSPQWGENIMLWSDVHPLLVSGTNMTTPE